LWLIYTLKGVLIFLFSAQHEDNVHELNREDEKGQPPYKLYVLTVWAEEKRKE
jgi:hypothetical protein